MSQLQAAVVSAAMGGVVDRLLPRGFAARPIAAISAGGESPASVRYWSISAEYPDWQPYWIRLQQASLNTVIESEAIVLGNELTATGKPHAQLLRSTEALALIGPTPD